MRALLFLFGTLFLSLATQAMADPCEAIPEDGPTPAYLNLDAVFTGPVNLVIDGDSICVAVAPGPAGAVEVRLADFYAPESAAPGGRAAKAALEKIALGRTAVCTAGMRTHDRIAARCVVDGRPLGDTLRAAGISEGGNGRRPTPHMMRRTTVRITAAGAPFQPCAAARAAGATPLLRGRPGYNPILDGDNDGRACEPIRRK